MQVNQIRPHLLLLIFALPLFSSGCFGSWVKRHDAIRNNSNKWKQISVESCKIHSFLLDSVSVPVVYYCRLVDNNETTLSMLNENINSIYLYNIETGILCDKITIPDFEGIQGYYLSNDTLILYSYVSDKLFIRIGNDIQILPLDIQNYGFLCPKPFLMTSSPIEILNDGKTLVMPVFIAGIGSLQDEKQRRSILLYDYKSGNYKYCVPFPEEYHRKNWGGNFAYMQPYLSLSKDGKVLISFAACHDLLVYDPILDQTFRYYAGSGEIKEIVPSSIPISQISKHQNELMEWYYRNPSYEGIYYDHYRHLYYRIARLALPDDRKRAREGNNKPVVIIVLDEKYNYLGEYHLPENVHYNSFCSFVSPAGFNIQVMNGNENELLFHELSFSL